MSGHTLQTLFLTLKQHSQKPKAMVKVVKVVRRCIKDKDDDDMDFSEKKVYAEGGAVHLKCN